MLVTRNVQPSLWESVLPEVVLRLPTELAAVDALLDEEAFFAPFRAHFDPVIGRPSLPMETYLRIMFLKHRYQLGYETLCREVSDSISWRLFCHIDLDVRVPHPTTLMKITTRCGEATVVALNEALIGKAVAAKVVKTGKVRADTTVVSANVEFPTDSGFAGRRGAQGRQAGEADQGRRRGAPHPVSGSHPHSDEQGAAIGARLRLRSAAPHRRSGS